MKRHYYIGYYDAIDEDGKKFSLAITGEKFKRKFDNIEELKREIEKVKRNMRIKDTTRTYENGEKVRLNYFDKYQVKFIIEEHFDEFNEVFVEEHERTYNDKERKFEEEIDVWI